MNKFDNLPDYWYFPRWPSKINNMLLVRTFWKSWWGTSLLFVIFNFFVIFSKMATMCKMAAVSYLKMVLWFYEYVLYVLKFCVCFCVYFDTLLFFPKNYSCFCSKVILCVWHHALVHRTVACKREGQNVSKYQVSHYAFW